MRSIIALAAAACLLLWLRGAGFSQTVSGGAAHPAVAWGEPVGGVRAGLSAERTRFEAGDRDWVELVLHIHNDSKEKVVLPNAGASHGWKWEFRLVGGGKPFVPRWDDDTAGQRAAPPQVVLEPSATQVVQARFRQRSFTKQGFGDFCSLVPGKYRISAAYVPNPHVQVPKGSLREKLTTGVVVTEIGPRGDAWDKLATADASTLVGLLGDRDRLLCAAATAFLSEKGKAAVPALIRGLQHPHAGLRAECAYLLGRMRRDAEPAVTALAGALSDADPNVRVKAAESLGWIGQGAKPAVGALVRAVKSPDSGCLPSVRPAAAAALGWIGDATPEVVAALAELLNDNIVQIDANAYAGVAYALGRLGPEAGSAVPVLVEQLQDKSNPHHWYILRALQGIGPGAGAAVPTLMRILEDEGRSMDLRVDAASALGRIGRAAKEALPLLEKLREKYRGAQRPVEQAFFATVSSAIQAIRKAEGQLPAKSN